MHTQRVAATCRSGLGSFDACIFDLAPSEDATQVQMLWAALCLCCLYARHKLCTHILCLQVQMVLTGAAGSGDGETPLPSGPVQVELPVRR